MYDLSAVNTYAAQVANMKDRPKSALQVVQRLNEENKAHQLEVSFLSKLPDNMDAKILDLAKENSHLKTSIEFREKKFQEHCRDLQDTMYINQTLQETV